MSQHLFKWKHFESKIIMLRVRWYLKYSLSYRMTVEMMQERGLKLTRTTITSWIYQHYPIISEKIRKHIKPTNRKIKYLNNIIEQDHRFIKRKVKPMLGFGSLETAEKTICGIEIMHMIKKGQVEEIQSALSDVQFIKKILGIAA
ncbi:MAG: transposase family protein [Firmicutes bacterium]|nr:transposase family protein [Bacillota bacterium]MBP2657092.1 transposase family protein [Bacillota bacterium]